MPLVVAGALKRAFLLVPLVPLLSAESDAVTLLGSMCMRMTCARTELSMFVLQPCDFDR